ncbi:restriction endonuclease subunit S [Draconibacterium sp. IB214405]|uniref:restriction endonuclease subunit S n=1 Tax=Draconibacterium sp. IB214405 TaxID=3097352 RepID=UPI002A16D811|nr:restriction endonuclease subunit S [Draconibacterium sp. IB214405]MDX8341561.1 restriction endonuclease subunit S [Draconibacterium sp. IB214405]
MQYKYSNTEINWLSKIPTHWKVDRIKDKTTAVIGGDWGNDPESDLEGENIVVLRVADLDYIYFKFDDLTIRKIKDSSYKSRKITNRCLVIEKSGGGEKQLVGRVGYPKGIDFDAICSNFMAKLEFDRTVDLKFANYLFSSLYDSNLNFPFIQQTTGIQNLNVTYYLNSKVAFPPLSEQEAITDYLDKACQRIDDIIAIKQKQLNNLQEIRKAKIYQAVTQGIKPISEWKELGFNQIEKIPSGWKLYRFKSISKIKYGLGQPPNEMIDGLPIIRATNVYRGKIDTNNLMFVDPDDVPYERDPILRKDDIIVVRSGAYTADSAIIPEEFDGAITGYDMVLRCNKNICAKFVAYALLSKYILEDQLILLSLRAAQPHLNKEELGSSRILLPDYDEQILIAEHLDNVTAKIDKSIENINNQITTLQAYRKSVIHECVTGKKQIWEGEIENVI